MSQSELTQITLLIVDGDRQSAPPEVQGSLAIRSLPQRNRPHNGRSDQVWQ